MNGILARQLIAADVLKLRRHRPTMAAAATGSVALTALYLAFILARHGGQLPGAQTLADGTSLLGLYFGSFAAILIGVEAGTIDLASGVFRDLAATGRPRTVLFLTRVPAAVAVALAFNLCGFVLTAGAAAAFHGTTPAPGAALIAESAGWVVLATTAVTTLAVGAGSLSGSVAVTLSAVIAWQTIASGILYLATFLGAARDLVLLMALSRFIPGQAVGTHARPGSSNTLDNYKLAMPAAVAIAVILAWTVAATALGAWRTRTRDA